MGRSSFAVVVLVAAVLAGCATPGPEPSQATGPGEAGGMVPGESVDGPTWQPGYTWSFAMEGPDDETQYDTQRVLVGDVEAAGDTYGLIVRATSYLAVPPAPDAETATQWGVFRQGSAAVMPFDPEGYDCEGARFCFGDQDFLALLEEPTGEPPFPLVAGTTFTDETEIQDLELVTEGTVVGMRDVTVPAGTFRAMHVSMNQTATSGDFSITIHVEADYAPEAQNWVYRSGQVAGMRGPVFELSLEEYSLQAAPAVDLASLHELARELNLTMTPPGPYNAAAPQDITFHATGGLGVPALQVRDDDFRLEVEAIGQDIVWTANRTGRWTAAAFDDGYGFDRREVTVGYDATVTLACEAPDPVGSGLCATLQVPIGKGSDVLRAWLNASLAPLGGTLELLRPDGVVEAFVEVDGSGDGGAAAVLAGDVTKPAGTWTLRWTPALPVPDEVELHVRVDVVPVEPFLF